MKKVIFRFGIIFIVFLAFILSCVHDPEETLLPPGGGTEPPLDTITCDSTNVTYPGTVYPILNAYCISCHSGTPPAGNLDFTNYDDVALVADNGALSGSINFSEGYSQMPKDGNKLSACEIALIDKWINDTTFNNGGGGGGIPCDPDTVYFQNTVLPLLQSTCGTTGCHDQASHQEDVILTDYFNIMETGEVKPFDPLDSKLYEVVKDDFQSDRMPPAPAPPLTQNQKEIIYKWIAQGALNNFCDNEPCDTLNVTFSGTIFPIIQNNCYGCHSGTNPSGGISLTNYQNIKAAGSISPGSYGSLSGTIKWSAGNIAMPENGNQLSDCKIKLIEKWIENGMPDN